MTQFDVVVVGGGPAGGHCGRVLAQMGHRVLLVERFRNFQKNSFSSGGTPMETLSRFALPTDVVGSFWNKLVIVTSHQQGVWASETMQGAVLDFGKLRQFLADEVEHHGGEVWMGCRYVSHIDQGDGVRVTLKNNLLNQVIEVQAQVLVDATGANRAIITRKGQPQPELLGGTGIEYLITVDRAAYDRNAAALTFLLGHRWMPKGYSWVFPMANQQLKVGAGILNQDHTVVDRIQPLKDYVELLIREYVQPQHYEVVDIHGETLRYSLGLGDRYTEGRVIAIGDTVSTVNFLGGEGIRHAMVSAEVASPFIHERLRGTRPDFSGYREAMHDLFLTPWQVTERLAMKKYLQDADPLVDRVISYLAPLSLEEVVDILFYYRFDKIYRGFWPYLWSRIQRRLQGWQRALGWPNGESVSPSSPDDGAPITRN